MQTAASNTTADNTEAEAGRTGGMGAAGGSQDEDAAHHCTTAVLPSVRCTIRNGLKGI